MAEIGERPGVLLFSAAATAAAWRGFDRVPVHDEPTRHDCARGVDLRALAREGKERPSRAEWAPKRTRAMPSRSNLLAAAMGSASAAMSMTMSRLCVVLAAALFRFRNFRE